MKKKRFFIRLILIIIFGFLIYYIGFRENNPIGVRGFIIKETNLEIDITALKQNNSDIYAWVRIPNTRIDYPILQGMDKEEGFYLTHDMHLEKNMYGAVYTEKENNQDFTSRHAVVYGHNMLDGSMFGGLHHFQEESFLRNNRFFYIYLEKEKLTYEIFAAYQFRDIHLLKTFPVNEEVTYREYLEMIPTLVEESGGNYIQNINMDAESTIVTLSTCTNANDTNRFLVQGVLVKREEMTRGDY